MCQRCEIFVNVLLGKMSVACSPSVLQTAGTQQEANACNWCTKGIGVHFVQSILKNFKLITYVLEFQLQFN